MASSPHGPHMKMPPAGSAASRFARVPRAQIERSTFDRSKAYKTTFNEGLLIPVYVEEVVPGDTAHVSMTAFARLTTPIKPLMDNMYLESWFFFVPTRLVWTHWVNFNGEQVNPGDSIAFTVPVFTAFTPQELSLFDYMGWPTHQATNNGGALQPMSLPARAYNLIYNQWFRDENMINSATVDTGDGPDNSANYVLRRRGKRHDYFTSCLPWPQKGTAVTLPLGTLAPVVSDGSAPNFTGLTSSAQLNVQAVAAANPTGAQWHAFSGTPSAGENVRFGTTTAGTQAGTFAGTGLEVDLSSATAATINALRLAFQTQKLLERDARGGTRYTEMIKAHFGVTSPDARLQRSEYLGGGSTPVIISPIAQSTQSGLTGGTTPQGNLSGIGTVTATRHGFVKSFTEHGYILGIVCVRADLTYQQGLDRFWTRSTRYDFYLPVLAHIGEQAVLQQEIYFSGVGNQTVFGYQERWGEMRYGRSMITGQFRSNSTTPLDVWHLSQQFASAPTLNQTFIEETAPMSRVVAVTTEPHFYFDSYFKQIWARPMPVFGVPGFVDHF